MPGQQSVQILNTGGGNLTSSGAVPGGDTQGGNTQGGITHGGNAQGGITPGRSALGTRLQLVPGAGSPATTPVKHNPPSLNPYLNEV